MPFLYSSLNCFVWITLMIFWVLAMMETIRKPNNVKENVVFAWLCGMLASIIHRLVNNVCYDKELCDLHIIQNKR